jgi:NADH dehydrogenase (ubiquinone) 1 alpha subcomplex subunit 9
MSAATLASKTASPTGLIALRALASVQHKRGMALATAQGRGGRSSVSGIQATVFGGTGFLGRYVINKLGRVGSQTVIPYRCDEHDTRHLKVMGDYGQIIMVPFHLKDEASIGNAVQHSNAVINLIGQPWPTWNFTTHQANVEGAKAIATKAKEAGVERFIHVSSLLASANSKSDFARTKAEAEAIIKDILPNATILRPGSMFGNEDRFLARIAGQSKVMPVFPLVDGGQAKRTPVYVQDVAECIMMCLSDPATAGQTYELGGPKTYTLEQVYQQIFDEIGKSDKTTVPVPGALMALQGRILQNLPDVPFSENEMQLASEDEVVSNGALTMADLGVPQSAMEDHIGKVLLRFRPAVISAKDAGVIL